MGIFFSPMRADLFWGPLNFLSNGKHRCLPRGVMWPGREADNSPASNAEVYLT